MATSNHVYGHLKVIKKDGKDGSCYPLLYTSIIGSGVNCDIRIHAPGVEDDHCSISPTDLGRVTVKNLSKTGTVEVNGSNIKNRLVPLTHCDVISVAHRSFRFEYPSESPFCVAKKFWAAEKLVPNSGTSGSIESNQPDGQKTPAGTSPGKNSLWNFSPFSSLASRQVAVVTPVMRVQNENVDISAKSRRHRSLAPNSHGNHDLPVLRRAGSTEVLVQFNLKSTLKKKSVGADYKVERKTPLKTPRQKKSLKTPQRKTPMKTPVSVATKKFGVPRNSASKSCGKQGLTSDLPVESSGSVQEKTPCGDVTKIKGKTPLKTPRSGAAKKQELPESPCVDSAEVIVQSVSESKKKKKSVGAVYKVNRKTPLKTPRSGAAKKQELPESPCVDSAEVIVQSVSESKKKSVGAVYKVNRKTPLKTPRSGAAKKLDLQASPSVDSTEFVVQSPSRSRKQNNSIGSVNKVKGKTPLKTPRLGSAKKTDLTVSPHVDRAKIEVQSVSESKKKNKSIVGVCKVEEETVLRTPHLGSAKKLGLSAKAKKSLSATPAQKSSQRSPALSVKNSCVAAKLTNSKVTPSRNVVKRMSKKSVESTQKEESSASTVESSSATKTKKSPRRLTLKNISEPQNLSTRKKVDYSSPVESRKRKLQELEARSEKAAKRLKLQGSPKSPDKKKNAALRLMCRKDFTLSGSKYIQGTKSEVGNKKIPVASLHSTGKLTKKSKLPVRVAKISGSKSLTSSNLKKSALEVKHGSFRAQFCFLESKNKSNKDEHCDLIHDVSADKAICKVAEAEKNVSANRQLILGEMHGSESNGNTPEFGGKSSFVVEPQATVSRGKSRKYSSLEPLQHPSCGQTSTPLPKEHQKKNVSQIAVDLDDSVLVYDKNGTLGDAVLEDESDIRLTPCSRLSLRSSFGSYGKPLHTVSLENNHIEIDEQLPSSVETPVSSKKHISYKSEPVSTPISARKSLRSTSGRKPSTLSPEFDVTLSPVDDRTFSLNQSSTVKGLADKSPESPSKLHDDMVDHSSTRSKSQEWSKIASPNSPQLSNGFSIKSLEKSVESNARYSGMNNSEHQRFDISCPKSSRRESQRSRKSLRNISSMTETPSRKSSKTGSQSLVTTPLGNGSRLFTDVEETMGINTSSGDKDAKSVSKRYSNSSLGKNSITPENRSSVGSWGLLESVNPENVLNNMQLVHVTRRSSQKSLASCSTPSRLVQEADLLDRSSQKGSLRKSMSVSSASFIVLDESQDENNAVNSNTNCNLHSSIRNEECNNEPEKEFCERNLIKRKIRSSSTLKKVSGSQSTTRYFLSSSLNCGDVFSEQGKITPQNNRFARSFTENLPSDVKVPSSILKSGRKSLRSTRKSVVRFMAFPDVEDDNQMFGKNVTDDTDTPEEVEHMVLENLSESVPEKLRPSASPARSGSAKKRKLSFKTNKKIILSTTKKHRNASDEISVQSDIAVCNSGSFCDSDIIKAGRKSSVRSAKSRTSLGISEFNESSTTGSCIGNETSFDFDSIKTPRLSKDVIVSPLSSTVVSSLSRSSESDSVQKIPAVCLVDIGFQSLKEHCSIPFEVPQSSLQEFTNPTESHLIHDWEPNMSSGSMPVLKSPLISLSGVRKALKTPKVCKSARNSFRKSLLTPKQRANSLNNVSDEAGILTETNSPDNLPEMEPRNLRTTRVQKSPVNDLTDVRGIRRLMTTPKTPKSPVNDLTNIGGVKQIFRSPKTQKSPLNDLTDVRGLRRLMTTPKTPKSPVNDLTNIGGVKQIFRSPKTQKSPLNDLTDVRGLRRLMTTPKTPKSPVNDLTNIGGVKQIFRSPKPQKSPLNDLTDVRGLRTLMTTPKTPKSPVNDLTNIGGVKQLFRSPKTQKSPLNDLSNVRGLRRLMTTPKTLKSPVNDLTDVTGIERLLRTPTMSPLNISFDRGSRTLVKSPITQPKDSSYDGEKTNSNMSEDSKSPLTRSLIKTIKTERSPVIEFNEIDSVTKLQMQDISNSVGASVERAIITTVESLKSEINDSSPSPARMTRSRKIMNVCEHSTGTPTPTKRTRRGNVKPVSSTTRVSDASGHALDFVAGSSEVPGIEANVAQTRKPSDTASPTSTKEGSLLLPSKPVTRKRRKVEEVIEPEEENFLQNKKKFHSSVLVKDSTVSNLTSEDKMCVEEENVPILATRSKRGKAYVKSVVMPDTLHAHSNQSCDVSKEAGDLAEPARENLPSVVTLPEKQTVLSQNKAVPDMTTFDSSSPSVGRSLRTRQKTKKQEIVPNLNEIESPSINSDLGSKRQTRRNKKTETSDSVLSEVTAEQENVKPDTEVRKTRRQRKVETVENLILAQQMFDQGNAKPEVKVTKPRRNKKTESAGSLVLEDDALDQENIKPDVRVRTTRRTKKDSAETTAAKQPARKPRRNKENSDAEPVEPELSVVSAKPKGRSRRAKPADDEVAAKPLSPETDIAKSQTKREVATTSGKPSRKKVLQEPVQNNIGSLSPRKTRNRRAR
ncbi:proliferation marker protein Ki-67-like isoform X2 [Bacillus rossius redtenbacheri]|uniref:proliferation marker protein Ki-67-like isoform X2 n=1 Tax=Bacillus rossius redtenbacheri TaxID=93214 RepID=UPI002FDD4DA4